MDILHRRTGGQFLLNKAYPIGLRAVDEGPFGFNLGDVLLEGGDDGQVITA